MAVPLTSADALRSHERARTWLRARGTALSADQEDWTIALGIPPEAATPVESKEPGSVPWSCPGRQQQVHPLIDSPFQASTVLTDSRESDSRPGHPDLGFDPVSPRRSRLDAENGFEEFLQALYRHLQTAPGSPPAAHHRIELDDGTSYPVGRHARTLRERHVQGLLDNERVAQLEAIDGWSWATTATSDTAWQRRYEAVLEHVRRHGSLTGLDKVLANWLRAQRDTEITAEQRARLEQIPGFLQQDRRAAHERFIRNAKQWLQHHPDAQTIPVRATLRLEDGTRVSVGRQAAHYRQRRRAGTLPRPVSRAIESSIPNWTWSP